MSNNETPNMAVFCDFENIAIGVRETGQAKFDINKVLERLLLKGSIVVKKAYCDWNRYEQFKRSLHEAAFELIDIPHVRQTGKNSADIRMVVDALDLCYTKEHVDTFVVISGDSDFSPLVSKLRENNKTVVGLGVKHSTSDLLVGNCDEFIFYDDLVRSTPQKKKAAPKKKTATKKTASRGNGSSSSEESGKNPEREDEAIDLVVETFDALSQERGENDVIWGSMVKQAIKRRRPGFNERFHGFRSFNTLLEEVEERGLIILEADDKSGGYTVKAAKD